MSCENGFHEYAEHVCEVCGEVFCFSCCETNASMCKNPENEYWVCPACGHWEEPYRMEEGE